MADKTEIEAGAEMNAGFAAQALFDRGEAGNFAALPPGFQIHDLEGFQEVPNRIRADHRFVSIGSLATYLNRFGGADTFVAADYSRNCIPCVIDGNAPGEPQFGQHKARYEAVIDERLAEWLALEGKSLAQATFGLFLEDRATDVVRPDAASVMEMVMQFDATKKVTFKSSQRLHDGARQFQYVEDNEVRGAVTLPDHFVIQVPVFAGMEPQPIKVMVRYRIDDGRLVFLVQMHDRKRVLREAFDRCVDALATGLKIDVPIYEIG